MNINDLLNPTNATFSIKDRCSATTILPEIPRRLGLCVNIVHTNLENKQLTSNEVLLRQLRYILVNDNKHYHIQVLMNGTTAHADIQGLLSELLDEFEESEVIVRTEEYDDSSILFILYRNTLLSFYFIEEILPLGSARDYLADRGYYNRYINIDEDDNFTSNSVLGELFEVVTTKMEGFPLAMFGFRWYYEKNGWLTYKDNPFVKGESHVWTLPEGKVIQPISMESMVGLCSWNLVHDSDYYQMKGLRRPAINKYDDCIFYNRILDHISEIPFIPLNVYSYHAERAVMSKEQDPYMTEVTSYINSDKIFRITHILKL